MTGILEDPENTTMADAKELAEALEQFDLAVAVERLDEADNPDEANLPFYEGDREAAFGVGMMVGAALERESDEA